MIKYLVPFFFLSVAVEAGVLLTDDFGGSSVDPQKWLASTATPGSSVTVADGCLNLLNRGVIASIQDFSSPIQIEGRFQFMNNPTSNFYIWLRSAGFGQPGIGIKFEIQAEPWNPELRQISIGDYTGSPETWLENVLIYNHTNKIISLDTWYNFRVIDTGSEITLFFNDATSPTLSLSTSGSAGSKVAFFNREGSANGSSISEGGLTRFDSITISVPEPSALSLLAVGLGVVLRQRRRTV